MLLYYIRHGNPIYDPDSLTPLGLRQAEAVGRRLSKINFDTIYVSSSKRAQLTAKPLCEILQKEPVVLDWTNEHHVWNEMDINYEDGTKTWCFRDPDIRLLFSTERIRQMGRYWYDAPEFSGTNFKKGSVRVQTCTDELLASLGYVHDLQNNCYNAVEPNDRHIALFAHQGFGLQFLSCVLDIPYPMFTTHFDLTHSSVTIIEFPNKKGTVLPVVDTLANDGHLYEAGLPMKSDTGLIL